MKKFLGITVLLAVVAACLTFTACQDTNVRSVLFINKTKVDIILQGNFGTLTLPKCVVSGINATDGQVTASMTGKPVVLERIVINDTQVGANPEQYIYLDGDVTASQKQPNSGAISLESGVITFTPLILEGGNPAKPKIDTISLDD
jgi:hypothetical protein